ncbi:MAG: GGDEF domain-containing protein [Zoogloeaceae bacterium]|jgi:diguanylate cyclase (GGDEF)-like protein|nr:GGDEF domain-containing protein [Zoogloeaceae bacterium]
MRLKSKILLFFTALSIALVLVVATISFFAFQSYSVAMTAEHVRTASEIIRVHLTDAMINGSMELRQGFLKRITEVQGLRTVYVVRSPLVDQQFGVSNAGELVPDDIEQQVMRDGMQRFETVQQGDITIFRSTIPYVADSSGTPNCLQCHNVRDGAVLGAVTMTMDISRLRQQTLMTVGGIAVTVALFLFSLFLFLNRLLRPISKTAKEVEEVVLQATKGNFKSAITIQTNDEVGQIARALNQLLRFLDDGLNHIGRQVSHLTGREPSQGENLLAVTIDMVEGLTRAQHFKQAIEEDEAKVEIYQRLSTTLQDEFNLREFSIYEITQNRSEMESVIVDGNLSGACHWCNSQVLERPETCRARRTGHMVDGVVQPDICYAFNPPMEGGEDYGYMCFPILQSGVVGSIVQLVVKGEEKARLQAALPYINVYLREAAPVLEARRLTETLKESSLRDPMTGLNNRRYLEEYVETLLANVRRQQIHLAIMMLDLDYFKMVNDSYGHDAGDAVLKALSQILRQSVRTSDMVIRYGGEEFLIVLQDTTEPAADQVAENIRRTVEKLRVNVGGTMLQKTISIGLSDYPTDSSTFWQAVKFADVALYRAKQTGRNRVVRFTQEMWEKDDHDQDY